MKKRKKLVKLKKDTGIKLIETTGTSAVRAKVTSESQAVFTAALKETNAMYGNMLRRLAGGANG